MSFVSGPTRVIRVIRGGCWSRVPLYVRVADRSNSSPDYRYSVLGVCLMRRCT